jgi:hypothetical protein
MVSFGQWCRSVLPVRSDAAGRPRRADGWSGGLVWPAPAAPCADDEADRGWHASSAALAQGLEVTELDAWPPEALTDGGGAAQPLAPAAHVPAGGDHAPWRPGLDEGVAGPVPASDCPPDAAAA